MLNNNGIHNSINTNDNHNPMPHMIVYWFMYVYIYIYIHTCVCVCVCAFIGCAILAAAIDVGISSAGSLGTGLGLSVGIIVVLEPPVDYSTARHGVTEKWLWYRGLARRQKFDMTKEPPFEFARFHMGIWLHVHQLYFHLNNNFDCLNIIMPEGWSSMFVWNLKLNVFVWTYSWWNSRQISIYMYIYIYI